jgi:hypothetical protein
MMEAVRTSETSVDNHFTRQYIPEDNSEQQAISSAKKKPARWFRYVDDTFVVWTHGKDELQEFLKHPNNIHPNIMFTMEVEQNKTLPFLDVLVSRRSDSSLGHSVYRKSTHTDLYLHAKSAHQPAQKRAVLTTLVRRARTLCDSESLRGEIQHLKGVFLQNEYSKNDIRRALHPKQKPQTKDEKPVGVALRVLPYQQTITNKISRFLAKHNIRTIHIPKKKNIHMLRPVKDDLGLNVSGVYRIPCECGDLYPFG